MDKKLTHGKYILVDQEVVEVKDLYEWANWIESSPDRRVAFDDTFPGFVSTLFLGLDHSFGIGEPLFFETYISGTGTELDGEIFRYTTYKDALNGHKGMVMQVRNLKENDTE